MNLIESMSLIKPKNPPQNPKSARHSRSALRSFTITAALILSTILINAQGSGTPSTLRVKTDANGYLIASGMAQTNPTTTTVFNNTRLKTDSNGYLLVVVAGGTGTFNNPIFTGQWTVNGALCAAGQLLQGGSPTTCTATPSVTSITLGASGILSGGTNLVEQVNGTNSQLYNIYKTFTSSTNYERLEIGPNAGGVGATIFGISPTKGSGGGTLRGIDIRAGSNPGEITLNETGNFGVTNGVVGVYSTAHVTNAIEFVSGQGYWYFDPTSSRWDLKASADNLWDIGAAGATRPRTAYLGTSLNIAAKSTYGATADKLIQINDNANATGMELNVGTPTLGTCTGGTMVSGSHNFGGEVTGNTSGSCVINFGTPNFTNTPFCTLNDESSLTAIRISARSASSITVTGTPSGDAFQFMCVGRIGT